MSGDPRTMAALGLAVFVSFLVLLICCGAVGVGIGVFAQIIYDIASVWTEADAWRGLCP